MSENQTVDLAGILDNTLDALADAPTFEPYHPGGHKVVIEFEGHGNKPLVINKHPAIKLKMKLVETLELNDPSLTPQVAGSEGEVLYMLDNEMGQGTLKRILKSLGEHLGADKTNRQIMEEAKGLECVVITAHRQNKDKTQTYTDVKEIKVV